MAKTKKMNIQQGRGPQPVLPGAEQPPEGPVHLRVQGQDHQPVIADRAARVADVGDQGHRGHRGETAVRCGAASLVRIISDSSGERRHVL